MFLQLSLVGQRGGDGVFMVVWWQRESRLRGCPGPCFARGVDRKSLVFGPPKPVGGGVTGASTLAVGRERSWGRVPKLLDHQQGPELFAHSPHEGMREPLVKFLHQQGAGRATSMCGHPPHQVHPGVLARGCESSPGALDKWTKCESRRRTTLRVFCLFPQAPVAQDGGGRRDGGDVSAGG